MNFDRLRHVSCKDLQDEILRNRRSICELAGNGYLDSAADGTETTHDQIRRFVEENECGMIRMNGHTFCFQRTAERGRIIDNKGIVPMEPERVPTEAVRLVELYYKDTKMCRIVILGK